MIEGSSSSRSSRTAPGRGRPGRRVGDVAVRRLYAATARCRECSDTTRRSETSIFGTVYEPRNFNCVSHACSTWQALTELTVPMRSAASPRPDDQRFDQRRPVAELAGVGRIDDVAVVGDLPPGARAALEDDAVRQPHVDADVEPVPVIDHVAAREERVDSPTKLFAARAAAAGRLGVEAARDDVARQRRATGRGRARRDQRSA